MMIRVGGMGQVDYSAQVSAATCAQYVSNNTKTKTNLDNIVSQLRAAGYTPEVVDMSEPVYGGGACVDSRLYYRVDVPSIGFSVLVGPGTTDISGPLSNALTAVRSSGSSSSQSSSGAAPTFSFRNTSTGDASLFRVGEQWHVSITGPPGAQVSVSGGKNGDNNTAVMGSVGGNGAFERSGVPTSAEIGRWAETWYVDSKVVGSVSFQVVAVRAETGGGGGTADTTGDRETAPPAPLVPGEETKPWYESLFSGGTLLLAGAAVAAFMIFSKDGSK